MFGSDSLAPGIRTLRIVSWQQAYEEIMILNVDRNALPNSSKVDYLGLIQNHDGSFQLGFFESVGISNYILHEKI